MYCKSVEWFFLLKGKILHMSKKNVTDIILLESAYRSKDKFLGIKIDFKKWIETISLSMRDVYVLRCLKYVKHL